MKIAVTIARVLLGLAFAFAGVMKFMPMQPGQIPPGDAGAMAGLMIAHKWLLFYGLVEAASASAAAERAVCAAGADAAGGDDHEHHAVQRDAVPWPPLALVLGLLELFLVWVYRESFAGIFTAKAQPKV